jgi:2-(1,2-epoxy-1,2-dihydrophenyl)acetyl-CoA isomerase
MSDSKILVQVENGIKTITLNHPKAKNALSPDASALLLQALQESYTDETRAIILTGAEGNFCSGADLAGSGMQGGKFDITDYVRNTLNPIVLAMRNIDIPVIAKVRGVAAGMGANFALACDMVFASENAMFSQIFTNIALSSDAGGAYFMAHALGYKKAYELMVTAAKVPAQEAHSLGLINRVLPDTELDEYVQNFAHQLANGALVAIKHTKANLREAVTGSLESTLELEAVNQGKNAQTQDFGEGLLAFMQKRKPNYKGK